MEGRAIRVERLKKRAKHCCCRYCGGDLHVRQLLFSSQREPRIELYCDQCKKVEFGVEKEAYAAAKAMVEATDFNHFPDLVEGEERKQMNIAKVANITSWQMRYLGLTDETGFVVPVKLNEYSMEQCSAVDEDELEKLLEEASLWTNQSSQQED